MSLVNPDEGVPRIADQLEEIKYGSPLAIVGLFVETIRARFRGDNDDTGYRWKPSPTPGEEEESTPGAPRTLYIESMYTVDPEGRNPRPAIYVDKEDTQLMKPVIGDRADIQRETRHETFWALAQIPISIFCVSGNKAESAQIADMVWFHIIGAKNYIRAAFGIHDISPPVLGRTQVYRRGEGDTDSWNTPISLAIQVQFVWRTKPVAPVLSEIITRLKFAGEGDALLGAIEVASRSSKTE